MVIKAEHTYYKLSFRLKQPLSAKLCFLAATLFGVGAEPLRNTSGHGFGTLHQLHAQMYA